MVDDWIWFWATASGWGVDVAVVGPNGAGKTTLMRIISCIIRPSAGQVEVFGHSVGTKAGKQAIKSGLGYLPQELGMYPDLTAQEFLDYFAILKGVTDGQKPNGRTTVVSSMHLQEGVQYRVLGDASGYENARTAEPSLEDGYIWLMQGLGEDKDNS